MNIFVLTDEPFPFGGAGSNRILSYSKGIVGLGHSVKIVCLKPTEKNKETALNTVVKGEFEQVQFEYASGRTVWPRNKARKVYSLIRGAIGAICILRRSKAKNRSTIALLYSNGALYIILFFLVSRILHIPYLQEKSEFPFVLNKKTYFGKLYSRIYVNYFYKFFDGMIIMTSALMEYFRPLVRQDARLLHVPMTVEGERFFSGKTHSAISDYVAYCGPSPGDRDGVPILVEAFKIIAGKYPALKLYLIGLNDDNDEWKDLVDKIDKLGLKERVILVGRILREEIPEYMNGARILALARPLNFESAGNFPTKLGEYLSTGNPVVVTRVGEVPLYLEHRINAFLCEPGDPKAFSEQMDAVLSDPVFAARVGQEGRALALKTFDYRVQSRRMVTFFDSFSAPHESAKVKQ